MAWPSFTLPVLNKKTWSRMSRVIMRSYRFQIPRYDLPIRFRPWFLIFTCVIMLALAFLGFTNFSKSLPLNDKLLHFLCFGIATGVFYFIFDVEEEMRRIWFWRYAGVIFTGFVCFFCGGILSEFVQSMLPYKEFQIGDVVANLLGSSIGLWIAYYSEKYYRYRREIGRLYRPLDEEMYSDAEDDDPLAAMQLLPSHRPHAKAPKSADRLSDVWDEREELFGVGDDSDDDEIEAGRSAGTKPQPQSPHPIPKITITQS